MKKFLDAVFLVSICFPPSTALLASSVLSSRGLGIPMQSFDARSAGMAGLSAAQSNPYSISGSNPAGLVSIRSTVLSLHFRSEISRYQTHENKASTNYSNFDGFIFALPFKSGLGIALQLRPLTRMQYTLSFRNEIDGQSYTKSVEGSGGVNSVSLSAFWGIRQNIAVGITGHYVFGKNSETWKVAWDDGDNFVGTNNNFSMKNSGFGISGGFLLKPVSRLMIGGTFSPKIRMQSTTDLFYVSSLETRSGNVDFPAGWSLGATAFLGKNAIWGLEYEERDWNHFSMERQGFQSFHKVGRIAAGGEFFSSPVPTVSYWRKMAYRIGFSYQPFYSSDILGKNLDEYWGTIGLGLPMQVGMSQIDAAFGVGRRGSLSANAISETLFKFFLSVTVGERWFVRGPE